MNRAIRSASLAAISALAGACASPPPTGALYVRAQAAPDPPPPPAPAIVRSTQPAALDPASAQMKPLPGHTPPASAAPKPKPAPLQLAADANHKATQAPDKSDYFNAIVQYAYEPGTLYQVYAQPMRITDIALEPGEKIIGEPASGDVVRWILALGKVDAERRRAVARVPQAHEARPRDQPRHQHRPAELPARASRLRSHVHGGHRLALPRGRARAGCKRRPPSSRATQKTASPVVGVDALNFDYTIQVIEEAGVDASAGLRRRSAHLRPLSTRPWCCARRRRCSSFATPRRSSSTTASRTACVRHRPADRCR